MYVGHAKPLCFGCDGTIIQPTSETSFHVAHYDTHLIAYFSTMQETRYSLSYAVLSLSLGLSWSHFGISSFIASLNRKEQQVPSYFLN